MDIHIVQISHCVVPMIEPVPIHKCNSNRFTPEIDRQQEVDTGLVPARIRYPIPFAAAY